MREGLTGEDAPQKFTENTFEGRRIKIYKGEPISSIGTGEMYFDRAIDEDTGMGYNYELQLALLLDGANPYHNEVHWPPELFKRKYVQSTRRIMGRNQTEYTISTIHIQVEKCYRYRFRRVIC